MNNGGIDAIYDFSRKLLVNGKKEAITKDKNKIIISIKFQIGDEEEELSF